MQAPPPLLLSLRCLSSSDGVKKKMDGINCEWKALDRVFEGLKDRQFTKRSVLLSTDKKHAIVK